MAWWSRRAARAASRPRRTRHSSRSRAGSTLASSSLMLRISASRWSCSTRSCRVPLVENDIAPWRRTIGRHAVAGEPGESSMHADKATLRARLDEPGFKELVADFDQAWPQVPRTRDLLEAVQAV